MAKKRDPRYDGGRRKRAAKLYRSGMSLDEVAAEMKVGRTRVTQLLKESGVKLRPRGRPRKSATP